MNRKALTLQDLYSFYLTHFSSNATFSSKDAGFQIAVQDSDLAHFDSVKVDNGLMFLKFKVCHIDTNRNGSHISEEHMMDAMPTLKYRPVLAYIKENEDGEFDFDSHNMTINEDGTVNYEEGQVGAFTADEPFLEYDEEADKTYVIAYAAIPVDYTKTAEILERKNGTKVSCELCINEMSYDAKKKVLNLTDFYFNGVTLLGEHVKEGMQGSRADIASIEEFSADRNSMFAAEEDNTMIKLLEEINTKLSNLNTQFQEKGGKDSVKLEELLEKYDKTVDDLDFDYENMSDEELEDKFEELFAEDPEPEDPEDTEDFKKKKRCSIEINGKTYSIDISLDEKIRALESLVNESYSEQDNAYYSVKVYDDHVIMINWWNGQAYRQSYTTEDTTYTLTGDRVEVYATYLTEEEMNQLKDLKSNYEDVSSRLDAYVQEEETQKKNEIISNESYDLIRDTEEFTKLVENVDNLTYEEVVSQCDQMLLNYVKSSTSTFAASNRRSIRIGASHADDDDSNIPYKTLRKKK